MKNALLIVLLVMVAGADSGATGTSGSGRIIGFPNSNTPTTIDTISPYDGLSTGIIGGGEITINGGDAAKFDVASGSGIIADWTTPMAPTITNVEWDAFTAVTVTGLATDIFTTIGIDVNGDIVQHPGAIFTPAQERNQIHLQVLVHTNNTTIQTVGTSSAPAYNKVEAVLDWVRAAGPIDTGNNYAAASNNLTVEKLAGQTTFPFINRSNDPQSPSTTVDSVQDPVAVLVYTYHGGGDSFPQSILSAVDPDNYAPSGTLVSVGANKWTAQRFRYFAQSSSTTVDYGSVEYSTLAAAQAGFSGELHVSNPNFESGYLSTVLYVKAGTTDLSDTGDAVFENQP